MSRKKRVVLVVQGEGRGHMTQAISMREILISAGYEISAVLVGCSSKREIPPFFYEKIQAPVTRFQSPNFVTDKTNRSIRVAPSLFYNLLLLPVFSRSIKMIDEVVKEHNPDVLINFYDPLIGLYYLFRKPSVPLVCIAHQYMFLHPEFKFPEGHRVDRSAVRLFSKLTAFGSVRKLAISFYAMENYEERGIAVVPPLLRKDVFEQKEEKKDYYLIYLLNNGYKDEIIRWHQNNQHIEAHVFCDMTETYDTLKYGENLYFHRLDDKKFLEYMAGTKGLVSTAGFESVCEAMYLGKPVFMVPVEGHFEQFVNARDAFKAGAGIFDSKFDINKFVDYVSTCKIDTLPFRKWLGNSKDIFLEEINSVILKSVTASTPVVAAG
ncbi:MAG: glycosyltransferase family protein [Bacteroidia bacterium]